MDINDFYDIKEAAKILGYHPQSLRKRANKGTLRAVKRGRKWLFLKSDIMAELGGQIPAHLEKPNTSAPTGGCTVSNVVDEDFLSK